jgi:hypothetical protein
MFRLTVTDYVLWLLPQLCVSVVLWRIVRERVVRVYPFFTAYCVLQLIRFVILFAIGFEHRTAYFYAFWPLEIVDILLSIAVIRDIYRQIFHSYAALQTFGSALFHWATAVLVLVSAWTAAAAHGKEFDRVIAGLLVFDQAGTIVRAGLLMLLLVICLFFKLRWDRRLLGIVIGFSLYLLVDFAAVAVRRHSGIVTAHVVSLVRSLAYDCCALAWVWTFSRQHAEVDAPFPFSAPELEEWDATLGKLVR